MIKTEIHYLSENGNQQVATLELEFPLLIGDEIQLDLGGALGNTDLEVYHRNLDARDLKHIHLEIHTRKPEKKSSKPI